jgi:hypothetical protein
MEVEWLYNDETETLGHVTKLELDGIKTISPQHALSSKDIETAKGFDDRAVLRDSIAVAGEVLSLNTLQGVGRQASVTDMLIKRLEAKIVHGRINFVYPRISSEYNDNGSVIPIKNIDDLQASALVGVQLEAGANAIIPPLPNGIASHEVFERVLERTRTEIQTFRKEREIIGLIPKTEALDLIPSMVKEYIKMGVHIFAIDFSSSPMPRSLIRTTVGAIRRAFNIKKTNEPQEKNYYLHVFNAAVNIKSTQSVSPITDILTHAYGVDSTSGVMWGGGKLETEKLRYYNTSDYGAYRLGSVRENGIAIPFNIPNSPMAAYETLRAHRVIDYLKDCKDNITERISNGSSSNGYAAYLLAKERPKKEVKNVLSDIREIKAH